MSKNIAVLDIGTTGVRILAAKVNEGGLPHIIAKSAIPCRGIKKYSIVDKEGLTSAVSRAVQRIQEQTGILIRSVYASVQCRYIKLTHNKETLRFSDGERELSYHDVAVLLDKVASIEMYEDEVLVDVSPLKYLINGDTQVADPVGLSAGSLGVEADVVLGHAEFIAELREAIEDAGLSVDGFIPVPMAMQGLMPEYTEDAKSTLLIDVGGSVTDYTLYYKGKTFSIGSIPLGGDNISSDIAQVFKVSLKEAESIKRDYPLATTTLVTNNIDLAIQSRETGSQEVIKIEEPVKVMQARIEELFSMIAKSLEGNNINTSSVDRIVITGDGIVNFKGVDEICKKIFGVALFEIDFTRLTGMKSIYTYASGMVMYISSLLPLGRKQSELAREYRKDEILVEDKKQGIRGVKNKFMGKMKDMLTGFRE